MISHQGARMTIEQQPAGVTRRDILLGAAGGVAAALTPAASAAALAQGASVSGIVFEENNGSAARGPGVPNVLVSNGRDVAVTDAQGRYTLPLPDEATIFVVKPSGFMPPVDPVTGSPRFYRLHQPNGSPASLGLAFEGVAPAGALPAPPPLRRRRAAWRPARLARFRASPPGRAEKIRCRDVHRSPAGIRGGSGFHSRGRNRGARRNAGEIRPHGGGSDV